MTFNHLFRVVINNKIKNRAHLLHNKNISDVYNE